ncbi:MAG TPA: DNA mismatch repair protein MutS [Chitinophagaceae bacterium]|nr:DNA mismatch repair protein MutS [Chitinophagaceae bacterium]
MSVATYQSFLSKYSAEYKTLSKKLGFFGFIRLIFFLSAIACLYFYFTNHESGWLIATFVLMALFFVFVRLYQRTKDHANFTQKLIEINTTELAFLEGQPLPYDEGEEFVDTHHAYSYDLDIFGRGSLYAFLNRTTTSFGKENLAKSLINADTTVINERQESIRELTDRIGFRQHIQASGSLHVIEQNDMDKLKAWLKLPVIFTNPLYYYLLLLFPLALLVSLILYFSTDSNIFLNVFSGLFILNFLVTAAFLKGIMKQVSLSTSVSKVLDQFEKQLKEIEGQDFQASLLRNLQSRLSPGNFSAARNIKQLGTLFKYLDFIINPVMSAILNGLSLFHIHILFALDKWKKRNDTRVMNWLQTIGEFESLNSFANLAFNNPGYCYPVIAKQETIDAVEMAHPLIRKEKTVSNSISFQQQKFIVLTGSNMSGKSTFLRTLGVNIVLAKAGSVVCAKNFSLYPYDLYVSMRITDSLQDSESFFYAELKKLREIIQHLERGNKTFVMLDEILRGTNSNDKHSGTVGLIRKLVGLHATGIIATHDLTIGELSSHYPDYMGNKCFESEIVNGELVFDYKLKEGICTKLNASFLLKKMGVID